MDTLRFADHRNGYAFGDHLWTTTDGGGHWSLEQLPGQGRIEAMAATADTTYLLMVPPGNETGPAVIYRAPAGSGNWRKVLSVPISRDSGADVSLAVHDRHVWLMTPGDYPAPPGAVYRSTDTGGHWTHATAPCGRGYTPTGIGVAPTPDDVALTCTGDGASEHITKHVYVSTNGGRTFTRTAADPPTLGDTAPVTLPSPGVIVVGSSSVTSMLYRSDDNGGHWTTAFRVGTDGNGQALRDLGFTTPDQGVVVVGIAAEPLAGFEPRLYLTRDAGRHWASVEFTPENKTP